MSDLRLARLLTMLPWLQAHPGCTWEQVTTRFAISEAELVADLTLLDNCSLPGGDYLDFVEISYGPDAITVERAQSLDRPLQLTGEEAVALLAAGQALADLPGVASPELASALGKLAGLVGVNPPEVTAGDDPVLRTLQGALERRRRLRIRHRSESRDAETQREVSPVTLLMRQGAPYLEAWCHSSGGARLFRVDRITEAIELEEPAAPGGQRMDVDDLGLIRRAPGLLATLELHPAARWVTEEQPMTVLSESPDGTLTVEVPVSDRAWVVRLALRLGGRVRVLAPPDLVEEVSRAARAGLAALDG